MVTPQDRWKAKNMARLSVWLPKDLAAEFTAAVEKNGDTKVAIIKAAIMKYLDKK
ncbi:MAG: ribbon-helix-helix domain-containing protein [Selenomonadaceae bacterium]